MLLPRSPPPAIVERYLPAAIECSCRASDLAKAEGDVLICRSDLEQKWSRNEVILCVLLALAVGVLIGLFVRGREVTPVTVAAVRDVVEKERPRTEDRRRGGGILRGREGLLALRG